MKKIVLAFYTICAISLIACQKENSASSGQLEASKTTGIKMGEPVLFSIPKVMAGSTVNWSVTPNNNNIQINATDSLASIRFGQKGNFIVTATSGTISQRTTVTVDSTIYDTAHSGHTLPSDTLRSLAGDEIKITPSVNDLGGDSSILVLSATTTKKYNCLNNYLVTTLSFIDGVAGRDYTLEYPGVNIPSTCTAGTKKATSMSFVYPVASGTHNFKVLLNGTTYRGSFTKVGKTYTFTWLYTNGVTISPLVVR